MVTVNSDFQEFFRVSAWSDSVCDTNILRKNGTVIILYKVHSTSLVLWNGLIDKFFYRRREVSSRELYLITETAITYNSSSFNFIIIKEVKC